ncbi:uncharacterized protein C8R40DRAFT_17876 [Lentinula edodes]|uniref:uncharacterized protein n=1 Tax=Lentinula edodes TaxID=5353 RepID=UPI001E8CFC07|nr:uncharacterized protein C8R40DRAFT_17876 [Lentinula edodes]KAH7881130.1 hypothetical protein C8R40DRAFT_17876 [Lentinula edodes]
MPSQNDKRDLSPSREAVQNSKKRIHLSSPEPIIIDDDSDDDDDLTEILAQIKQQEDSEKLAKQLQDQYATGSSSGNAILIEDDPDEQLFMRLASNRVAADAIEQTSEAVPPESSGKPRMKSQMSLRFLAQGKTPTESLSPYRIVFTAERPCTKCGETVKSPRGYVMLSGETISPSLGFLLHAPCPCKTNHCRGCFKPHMCVATCKGIAKNSTCTVDTCCTEVRAIALFEALGSFDRQYIGEKAVSHSRAAAIASDSKRSASGSVGPGGTGYGVGHGGYGAAYGRKGLMGAIPSTDPQSKALAAHWEVQVTRALRMITALLPSPYAESPQAYDLLPHPSVGHLLNSSKIPDLLGDLLRNDSVTDWITRSDVYYAMLALLKRMADSELTVSALLEARYVPSKGQGIEQWMWEESEIEWEKGTGGKLERAPPLYEYFKKLSKQSEAFLAGASRLMETEENPEEIIRAISLCGDIIAARDDIERAISVLGVSSDTNFSSKEDKDTSKGKGKADSVELEQAYSLACERLAFRHIPLDSSDSGKGKATGLHYDTFNYATAVTSSQNGTRNPKDRLHLVKELAVLATSLPPGIWVRVDEVRNDVIKIMIAGPEGTPYAGGLWEFDCFMPLSYPAVAPQMHLRTTGGGKVRFNPNLYDNGKVCLSLLGTWPGSPEEQWLPYKSTLLQVLVSIQSMILIDLPYFNEPGLGRANPKSNASIHYNRNISLQTTRWAIVDWLKEEHRNGIWGEVIASHFSIRKEKIRKQICDWAQNDPKMRSYTAASTRPSYFGTEQPMDLQVTIPLALHGMDLVKEFDERMLEVQEWNWNKEF